MPALIGPYLLPAKVERIVVLLHGYGANGDDLIGLGEALAPALPNTAFYAPNAPTPCEINPQGLQWWSLEGGISEVMEPTAVLPAKTRVHSYIDELLGHHNLSADALALTGFSQGGMLSLYAGLRYPQPLNSIVSFAGLFLGPQRLAAEMTHKVPTLLVHGLADTVVPYAMMPAAQGALQMAGVAVETLGCTGAGHWIDPDGLRTAASFLRRQFKLEA